MKRFALISALVAGFAVAAAPPAEATSIAFHVQVTTAPLIGNPAGPFSLDFLLNDASGTLAGPNTVVISDFNFAGGSPTGAPTLFGGASGSLSSSVTLSDSANFSNEFFQAFTPGTALGFDVVATTNSDGLFGDTFSIAILDGSLANLPTTGFGDTLLAAALRPTLTVSAIQRFSTTSPPGVGVTADPIPEPGTLLLLGTGVVAAVRRRIRN
jgi:hypothetical protein